MQGADSVDADQTNTKESSMQENKTEQKQRSGSSQMLKIYSPSSPRNYEKPFDPVLPPRNVSHCLIILITIAVITCLCVTDYETKI